MRHPTIVLLASSALACGSLACSAKSSSSGAASSPSGSEVAVSAVSGALNNSSGGSVAWHPKAPVRGALDRALAFLSPVSTAYAADWSCTGASLSPTFRGSGGNPYSFTPPTCKVTWADDLSATSTWSGPFILNFGSSCDATHADAKSQAAGCDVIRTTPAGGDTRTITGPDKGEYEITHDTNGAGSGWDATVSPAPSNSGVELTCASGGCASGGTLVIHGSHLTGTVDLLGIHEKIWDHTVTASGLVVTSSGSGYVVNGTVTVQHNILKATSTTTFTSVTYGDPGCCFPTQGSVSTVYDRGLAAKAESITFGGSCGETTLVDDAGKSVSLTLTHCL
jgi:hypothetical protein